MKRDAETKERLADMECKGKRVRARGKKWQKPNLKDVSGKVMAQPYIRFT